MREQGKNPKSTEAVRGEEKFPLPLSRIAEKCTVVWSIAGFDPSSGAGLTADLMTFAAHGLFGCAAPTALTVQTTLGVFAWEPVRAELLGAMLDHLEQDLPFDGVKIGMLGRAEAAQVVGRFLGEMRAKRQGVVVLDPVLRSSSGRQLFATDGIAVLHGEVLPHVDWITPNWSELEMLAEVPVQDLAGAERAGRALLKRHPRLHIVATGGDQKEPTELLLRPGGQVERFPGEHVETRATHGTGCAFSSALLSRLVLGAGPAEAVRHAKEYVEQALRAAPGVGGGRGPMGLLWPLQRGEKERGEKPCC